MALKTNKLAAATALAAAFSMLATPVQARGWHHRGYHDDVDAGDVLAGVLILGGIAAIASAANKNNRERQASYPPLPPRDSAPRYQTPGNYERYDSRGMDHAVDMCVAEVERRSGRVDTVDGANRNRDGWQVSGTLAQGAPYSCWIGNDGNVSDVDVGAAASGYSQPADGQWDDDAYIQARAAHEMSPAQAPVETASGDDGRYSMAQAPDFGD